jgi:hypothetical protein
MGSQYRLDFIPFTPRQSERLPEGYLRADAIVARTGIQTYLDTDGRAVREYRPESEVANPDSLATFGGQVVTDGHPKDRVDAANSRELQRGFTDSTVVYDKGFVKVAITLTDAQVIDRAESGNAVELSAGYSVDIDPTPGVTPNGESYDRVQRNIRVNHVAVVERGRAGPMAKLYLDSEDTLIQIEDPTMPEEPATYTPDPSVVEPDPAPAAVIEPQPEEVVTDAMPQKLMADMVDMLKAQNKDMAKQLKDMREKYDAMMQRMSGMKSDSDIETEIQERVKARVKLINDAHPILGSQLNLDAADRDIQIEVIRKVTPDWDPKDRSDAYIAGRFEGVLESMQAQSSTGDLRSAVDAAARSDAGIPGSPLVVPVPTMLSQFSMSK